ncbi:MAG TPA: hypothetical protein VGO07_07330 [Candidatus Saccharimonadales bacterium]|nr:hypothetical protein [Candidatus Saccharimonadales bacterium]
MDAKQALTDRLKEANNILVTVSNNPSVDQLASCIGLTLALNKMNKHATAVFSGAVPSTIEFLQPEKTIEKNTDSLRDFIISLDKAKADKLRYKVEDKVVKIFITPYKTSISNKDLEFSQGDFNVDAVVALGVHAQNDLDQAITSHGRILHDATVTTINVKPGGELGTINWLEPKASSLSELVAELVVDGLGKELLDEQMSTALLTGIVAETERFSNDKTIPATMTLSAELMAAGANQQLVATKLTPKPVAPPPPPPPPAAPLRQPEPPKAEEQHAAPIKTATAEPPQADDGTLEISHNTDVSALESDDEPKEPELAQINIDEQGSLRNLRDAPEEVKGNIDPTKHMEAQHMIMEPPSMGGQLTASVLPEDDEEKPAGDPLNTAAPSNSGLLQRASPFSTPAAPAGPPPPIISSVSSVSQESTPYPSPFEAPSATPPSPIQQSAPFVPQQPTVVTPTVAPPPPPPPPPAPVPAPTPFVMPNTVAPQAPPAPAPVPAPAPQPLQIPPQPPSQTLSELEQNVHSPHIDSPAVPATPAAPAPGVEPDLVLPIAPPAPAAPAQINPSVDVDSARNAVMQAIAGQPGQPPEPIQALNAQPLGDPLHDLQNPAPAAPFDPNAPPPVPPPMMPPAPQQLS